MKKIFFCTSFLFIILFCGIFSCSMLVKSTFTEIFYAEPTIIQTYVSPNEKYTAYVYESNGGATTGFIYHISIIPTERKLDKGNGNIYISDIPPVNLVWLDNSTLYVDDYKNLKTTKRKEKIYDITVKFKSLE